MHASAGLGEGRMRFAIDVGGTFSHLVVEDGAAFFGFKSATTPTDPVAGVMAALDLAAEHFARSRRALLEGGTVFVHATTRAINTILTGSAARTALVTTAGHPTSCFFAKAAAPTSSTTRNRFQRPMCRAG
jgi:N-methylhydantoinase A